MKLSLPRIVAVFLLAIALGVIFSFAYPGVDIDAALATVIVLVALAAESLAAFIYRRVTNRG
ncbi:hypothetical protein [Methylocystis suflitae]|jgi:hypothetical protein|uniref:hypothetical protein n=1 Tax=Methylocystis suflitae TaxID=2951405 RepID=UPI002108BB36|nr:hypothetical protein [Methylocystis suflitae]MCQ4190516.1 hypothetical protein [Methylocystis suflitae]